VRLRDKPGDFFKKIVKLPGPKGFLLRGVALGLKFLATARLLMHFEFRICGGL